MIWKRGILIAAPLVVLIASCLWQKSRGPSITAYGICPKCGATVRGGLVKGDGMTTDERPFSCVGYQAECKSCQLFLFAENGPNLTTRRICWKTISGSVTLTSNGTGLASACPVDPFQRTEPAWVPHQDGFPNNCISLTQESFSLIKRNGAVENKKGASPFL